MTDSAPPDLSTPDLPAPDPTVLRIPADLAVIAAEEHRQALLAALAAGTGPVEIVVSGEERLGVVALQLVAASAVFARAAGRAVHLPEATRQAVAHLGWEG